LQSWVEPYPKPIILNHDLNSEPIGRVMAAKMDKESDGSSFVRLQIAITDPVAIEKVLDRRYLTGSVGGRAGKAICSISGQDLAAEGEGGRPTLPKYRRGQVYKGKLAFVDMQDISFKEYSFVNQPADSKSGVRSKKTVDGDLKVQDSSDDWVAKSSAFVLSMDEEDIYSVTEHKSILKHLKTKESKPLYLQVKGSFLTAMAIQESENYKYNEASLLSNGEIKDNTESQENETMENAEKQEDILAVAEELSNSLSSIASEAAEETAPTQEEPKEEVSEQPAAEEQAEPAQEEISNDNSEKADEQADEAVDSEEAEKPEEKSEDVQTEPQEKAEEEDSLNGEDTVATESEDSEVLARVKALEEENAKLKKALHNTLVERVVDAKIAVGVESVENRDKAIEEHASRTASSLADSLRDLARMPQATQARGEMPEITSETEVVEGEENVITLDSKAEEVKADPKQTAEQLFVDALMGRRKL
jgi:hypothetical protein